MSVNRSAQIDDADDDRADKDVLHEGMNSEQIKHVAQAPDDQCAHNGHRHGAAPASEIHAADDAGGDGVQLVCVTLCGVDGVQLGRQQQPRHGGAEAGETEHEELQSGGAETLLAQHGFVAAERVDVVAERREALNEKAQREERQQQQVGQGDAAKRAVADEYKALGKPPIELPPFMVKASPWLIWPTTSVVMKAGTDSLDTMRPLNRPSMIPASMPRAMLAGRSIPASIRMPLIIGQNASRPARDRSIPLMTMTNVMPTAQMPVMDDCLTTLSRFDGSRKCGTCEPSARKAATGIRRNSPRRAARERFTSSERPLRTPTCELQQGCSCRRP